MNNDLIIKKNKFKVNTVDTHLHKIHLTAVSHLATQLLMLNRLYFKI